MARASALTLSGPPVDEAPGFLADQLADLVIRVGGGVRVQKAEFSVLDEVDPGQGFLREVLRS